MNTPYAYAALLAFMACCLAYLIILVRDCKIKLSMQNVQLIQLYLDKKFIDKLLNIVTEANKRADDALEDILSDIKEYFHLDDIVIYNPNKATHDPTPGVYLRNIVAEYIKNNQNAIFEAFAESNIVVENIENERIRCALYMLLLPVANKQQVVAFVHNPDAPLERYEIDTLAKSIRGILTAALNISGKLAGVN